MSGGCGYVLSRATLDKFIDFLPNATEQQCAAVNSTATEDVEMSRCLLNAGAIAGDSRDDELRMRYLPFEPHCMLKSKFFSDNFWSFTYGFYHAHSVSYIYFKSIFR